MTALFGVLFSIDDQSLFRAGVRGPAVILQAKARGFHEKKTKLCCNRRRLRAVKNTFGISVAQGRMGDLVSACEITQIGG